MSQKNEAPALILALIVTLGLLGGVGWWAAKQFNLLPSSDPENSIDGTPTPSSNVQSGNYQLSLGDRLLISEGASAQKRAAIAAIADGDYDQAIGDLEASLANDRNDPEALIYLNNARIGDQKAYTIAVAAPISSSVDSALEMLRGVAQAQNEINESGGINGTPLKVLIGDDANDAASAEKLAQAFVDDEQVLGVVGHFSSDVTIGAGDVYEQGKLVMISPTSTSVQLSQLGEYVFRTVQSDRFAADGLARYMVDTLQVQSVAIFYNSGSDYSLSLKDAFTSAVLTGGGEVAAEFDLAASDFNALTDVEQAIGQGAEAIMLAANTPMRNQAFQVIAANRQRLQLLGGDSLYSAEILNVARDAAVGMVIAAPWHRDGQPNAEFPNAARQLWGGDVSWRTAMSYDATLSLIAALRESPTRSGVQEALSSSDFSTTGASGTIEFLPSGDRNRATQLVEIEPGNASGYGFDFVPVP